MPNAPSDESQLSQARYKWMFWIVVPVSAVLGTLLSVPFDLSPSADSLEFFAALAGTFVGNVAFVGVLSFVAAKLAGRRDKSKFWPTAAWVAIALAVLSMLGK